MKHVAIQMVVIGNDWFNALSEALWFSVRCDTPVLLTYRGQKSWTVSPNTTADEIESMKLEQFRIGV